MKQRPDHVFWVVNKETGEGRWTEHPNVYLGIPNYTVHSYSIEEVQ